MPGLLRSARCQASGGPPRRSTPRARRHAKCPAGGSAERLLLAKKRDLHATNPRTVGCFRPKAPRSADAGPSARGITRGGHACGSCSFPADARLRRRLQQARQRAAAGGRLLRRAGLHRADLLAAVPQVPRRPRARAAQEAELRGETHEPVIDNPDFRWSAWASPKDASGNELTEHELIGDDLVEFVDEELFPYLAGLGRGAESNTLSAKVGEVFGEVRNKFRSGYALRDAADAIDSLRFRSRDDKHELSQIYEEKIKRMGNAGRNGGEYYTPRPLIRAIVEVVRPKLGETVMDPACGSAGFLCEGLDFIRSNETNLSPAGLRTLEERTFYGKEKKSLAYVIGLMNLILHGIDAPNLFHTNTLAENLAEVTNKDRHDIVLANPPFGGKERAEVQHNFPVRTAETAYLFLQHIVRILKPGGRAGVVIKNTFLSNADAASKDLRRELLESCNLHTVLDCPGGTFQGAGVKTVVLFFKRASRPRAPGTTSSTPAARSARPTPSTTPTSPTSFRRKRRSPAARRAGRSKQLRWTLEHTTSRCGTRTCRRPPRCGTPSRSSTRSSGWIQNQLRCCSRCGGCCESCPTRRRHQLPRRWNPLEEEEVLLGRRHPVGVPKGHEVRPDRRLNRSRDAGGRHELNYEFDSRRVCARGR